MGAPAHVVASAVSVRQPCQCVLSWGVAWQRLVGGHLCAAHKQMGQSQTAGQKGEQNRVRDSSDGNHIDEVVRGHRQRRGHTGARPPGQGWCQPIRHVDEKTGNRDWH